MAPPGERICDLLLERAADAPTPVSFEYFPPKTDKGVENLLNRIDTMAEQKPLFMDITWNAGGVSSDLTLELAKKIQNRTGINVNMHLTCTNMESEKVDLALAGCREAGIRNILALRGDPPAGQEEWSAVEGGFTCALDLVRHIRREHNQYFCVTVAGYPEGHPNVIKPVTDVDALTEAERGRLVTSAEGELSVCHDEDFAAEIAYLKAKVDAGADMIITQMIFDPTVYVSFVAACRGAGIQVPILPGVMCVQKKGGFERMTAMCKSRVPSIFRERLAPLTDEGEVKDAMIEVTTDLCRRLVDASAPVVHLYTLNLSKVSDGILKGLGLFRDTAVEQEGAVGKA